MDHYFSEQPSGEERRREIRVPLLGEQRTVVTANGTFSPDRLDPGTRVLLEQVPFPTPNASDSPAQILDIGCGWGPICLSLGLNDPAATVWAIDTNTRALSLTRQNAQRLGAHNIRAGSPSDVPADTRFDHIWSNPPIRIGKDALHELLMTWIPRLASGGNAWLVVNRNLGADSLQAWLETALPPGFEVARFASKAGFRIVHIDRE